MKMLGFSRKSEAAEDAFSFARVADVDDATVEAFFASTHEGSRGMPLLVARHVFEELEARLSSQDEIGDGELREIRGINFLYDMICQFLPVSICFSSVSYAIPYYKILAETSLRTKHSRDALIKRGCFIKCLGKRLKHRFNHMMGIFSVEHLNM